MRKHTAHQTKTRRSEAGTTLIEVSIALAILLAASVGILTLASTSMITTENQGHLMARAAEYSQDKMEQLISLAYTDAQSNTATFPTSNSGGTGLAVGGSSNPSAPATGYVDYLDVNGNPLAIGSSGAPSNWYYIRVWQITNPTGAPVYSGITTVKQVTVTTKVRNAIGGSGSGAGAAPQATMASLMTYTKP